MNENMTALISAFARMYHIKNSNIKIYDDNFVVKLIRKDEYYKISEVMKKGISFFDSNYKGSDPLNWIVNNNLAPSILARSAFNEHHLMTAISLGIKQYLILASGYDTSAFKVNNKVKVFELDKEKMIEDKLNRISNAEVDTTNINYIKTDFNGSWVNDLLSSNFNIEEKTFCSMLGISYYLDKDVFRKTIKELSNLVPKGSFILFDYPNTNETQKEKINKQLASGTSDKMKSIYSYSDIENIAKDSNMLIYEHLNHNDINDNYFNDYNTFNPNNKIIAPFGVSYIILIRE